MTLAIFRTTFLPGLIKALLFSVLLTGCSPSLNITGLDISSMYSGQDETAIHLVNLYNLNDSTSLISIVIPAGLIKPEPKNSKLQKRRGTLKYEVITSEKRVRLIDSATFNIADTSLERSFLSHSWTFKAPVGTNYFIKATYSLPDNPEDLILLEFLSKTSKVDYSWYRFQTEAGDFVPGYVTNYLQPYRLVTSDTTHRCIIATAYFRNFDLPYPPFTEKYRSLFDYRPDSTFKVLIGDGFSQYFTPAKAGFYFFPIDSSGRKGPTLFVMNSGFPKVTLHTNMLEALRYLTSGAEYRKLLSYANPKLAVDSFWIANSGRSDIATELIRKYYRRVETANKLFTSFTEGWKTDRGMIFLIFGKPAQVFRSFEQEVWIYGEINDPRALKFYFNKADNPFTANDYVLVRHEYFKSIWFQNVQLWRR